MEVKPGYKRTEVGVIPEEWKVQALKDVSIISRLAGAEYTSLWKETRDGEIIALRGFNIGEGEIIERDFVRISNRLSLKLKRSRLCKGDVVYPCVGSIGNAVVISDDDKYHIQQNIARITPNQKAINSHYLANYLMSSVAYREVERFTSSSSQPSVLVGSLRQYRVPLPPTINEQRAIAETLRDVDALISALDQLIAKKRDLKQAAMQQLLTGHKRLPDFHGEWELMRLDNFAPLQRGFDLPTSKIRKGDYPVVYSNGVQNHHAKFMVKGPGVVTGRSGTIGNVHFVEKDFWPHNTALWVTDFKDNDPKFVFYFLSSVGLERFGTGSGVPTLNRNDVHEFRVSLPTSSAEQTAIAEVLSDMDAELAALKQRRDKTRALKQGMMQELLTGRTRLV
jgi:type I restriction enzyme S subunit